MRDLSVFVDESGDLGTGRGSSRHLTIGAVATSQPKSVERIPQAVRKRVLRKSLLQKPELKFHNSNPDIRRKVLRRLMEIEDTTIAHVTLDKAGAPSRLIRNSARLYDELCAELLVGVIGLRRTSGSIHAIFDARPHNRPPSYDFNNRVGTIVENELAKQGSLPARLRISVLDSRNSRGLQVADFVAGSIQRMWERGDRTYYELLSPAVTFERFVRI